jgi:hypothetical protein
MHLVWKWKMKKEVQKEDLEGGNDLWRIILRSVSIMNVSGETDAPQKC